MDKWFLIDCSLADIMAAVLLPVGHFSCAMFTLRIVATVIQQIFL